MPLSLKTLENRRDGCIKKIEELKTTAFGIGGETLGNLQFNSSGFFTGLVDMTKEDINTFLSLFPQLPRVFEIARQAANEEKRRRKYEVQIEQCTKEKEIKMQQFLMDQKKKKRKKTKRLNQMKSDHHPALEEGSSQEME